MITELRRWAVLAACLCCTAALPSFTAAAQQENKHVDLRKEYALIYGTVWDAHDRPAYGVTVKIRREDEKKARWERTSDHAGEFALRVPPGKHDYIIWADVKMPKGAHKPQTVAHVQNDERVDVSLHLTE